jgi:ribosomal protein L13E
MQAGTKPTVKGKGVHVVRSGRGYSREELKEAGFDERKARKSGVPVDVWRRTRHPENVEQLKPLLKIIEESMKGRVDNKETAAKKTSKKPKRDDASK